MVLKIGCAKQGAKRGRPGQVALQYYFGNEHAFISEGYVLEDSQPPTKF